MRHKVFISFLGTNNYVLTHYEMKGEYSLAVRFIQQALVSFLCKDWTERDRILIFYTGGPEGSYVKNWLDNGQSHTNEDYVSENIGLQSTLQKMHLPMQIEAHEIVEGFSEKEIWNIFDCVYDKLRPGEEIYFDVTHAFRSIPLFSTVLFNYAGFMKGTRLKAIYYGAFEKLGPAWKVMKDIPVDKRVAPILDLTSLVDLQNTNIAASNIIEFGRVGIMANLMTEETSPVTRMQRKASDAIRCLKGELVKLDSYILTCRMSDIKKGGYVKNIFEQFGNALKSEHLLSSEKLLLLKIKENLQEFKPRSTNDNIEAAIHWAFRYGMIQQAYTLGQEYIISLTCDLLENVNPWGKDSKKFRKYVSALLGVNDGVCKSEYKGDLRTNPELTEELLGLKWIKALRKEYRKLGQNRNNINHAKGNLSEATFKADFDVSYTNCRKMLKAQKYAE